MLRGRGKTDDREEDETDRRREQKKKQTIIEEHSVIVMFPHIPISVGSSWNYVDF